jgi:hypothetical protein
VRGSCLQIVELTAGLVVLGGVVAVVLAIVPKVREFIPGRARWIFKGDKNPQHAFLRGESKAVGST